MNKLLNKTIILFSSVIAVLIMAQAALAHPPTAVTLAEFDVIPLNNQVRIEWATGSELNTAGYLIKRIDANGTEKILENVGDNGFVLAIGGVAVGGDYSEVDDQVQNGEVFTYVLIEVERSAQEIVIAQETVTVGIPPTNTPTATASPPPTNTPVVIFSGNNGTGNSSVPTSTATLSATAAATTNQPTSTPTNTSPNNTTNTTMPTQNANERNNTTRETSNSDLSSTNSDSGAETNTDITLTGASAVLAQEETSGDSETVTIASQIETESSGQNQDDYPGIQPTTTAVNQTNENYPENAESGASAATEATSTPVPVIGSNQSYENPQANEPSTIGTNDNSTTSTTQSRVYLWLGFIIALLIFITGLMGSILLFVRKAN